MERWSIKRLGKEVIQAASLEKKMNSQLQNGAILAKWCHFGKMCNSYSTSDASQLHLWLASNFQFRSISPLTNFNFNPRFQRLLYFGPWSQFFFNLTPNWLLKFQISSISPLISINWVPRVWLLLQKWSLAVNFFNLTLNWPQNFDFLSILPLIWIN